MIKRNGFTLVEMLVVISVGSTLMMLAVGLVHQSMTLSNRMQANCERMHATNRFIDQFRQDVHASVNVVSHDSNSLAIDFSDSSSVATKKIEYSCRDNLVLREEFFLDGKVRREELILGDLAFGSFSVESSEQIASFILQYAGEIKDAPPRIERISEAAIGRLAVTSQETEPPK